MRAVLTYFVIYDLIMLKQRLAICFSPSSVHEELGKVKVIWVYK